MTKIIKKNIVPKVEQPFQEEKQQIANLQKDSSMSIKVFSIAILSVVIILVGALLLTKTNQNTENTKGISSEKQINKITKEELAKHSTKDTCWLAISGKVYDVTKYISSHPGGEAILEGCGKDATDLFFNRPGGKGSHSPSAQRLLSQYEIGELE